VQVAQRVAKRRGIAQKGGKKQKQRDRVYLEYPSSPVMPEEGESCLDIASILLHCTARSMSCICLQAECQWHLNCTACQLCPLYCCQALMYVLVRLLSCACHEFDPMTCISFSKTGTGCMLKYSTLHMFSIPCRALLTLESPPSVHERIGGGRQHV